MGYQLGIVTLLSYSLQRYEFTLSGSFMFYPDFMYLLSIYRCFSM